MLNKLLMLIVGLIFLFIPPVAIAQMPMPDMIPAPSSSMILGFDTMAGVDGPFVGDANPIRGVPGGGRPWMIEEAQGELDSDGMVAIKVEGLVLVETGMNPSTAFKGIVSCLTPDDTGMGVTYVNAETAFFPATEDGNAEIVDKVMLPKVCVAPIVFVAGTSGNWFAVTGHMMKDEEEEVDEPEEMEMEEPEELDVPDELMAMADDSSSSDERDDRRDDRDREKIIRFNDDDEFDDDLLEFLFFNELFDDDELFDEEFDEDFDFDSDSSSSTLESDSSSRLGLRRAFMPRRAFFDRNPFLFDRNPFLFRRLIFDRDRFFPFFGLEDDDFFFEDFERDDD
jgi:hypothetical protein